MRINNLFIAKSDKKISSKEKKQINEAFDNFILSIKAHTETSKIEQIKTVFDIANKEFANYRYITEEPYIIHLINISHIVSEQIGLGTKSVISVFLFEMYNQEILSLSEIENQFSKNVAQIIEGSIKIANIDTKGNKNQDENFKKLLITLGEDIRVILIKLAVILQTMRSLNYMPEKYQIKRSLETFSLFAPLAHRLGLYNIKSELENLAFKYTENNEYKSLIKKLKNTTSKRNKFIKKFTDKIAKELDNQGFDYEIKGRPKSVFSIYQKMKKQNVEFEEVYDLFAIRIIINSKSKNEKSDCWRAYSIITDSFQPNPRRLRDWISVPKSNGYESLHTTVVGPDKKWVEVQIRTKRMDEIAEKGYAAHWKYKGVKDEKGVGNWLQKIRELLENKEATSSDVIDNFKLNLYHKEVFAFTPKGDLKKFPINATILDFAYDIHSDIGEKCIGGKINNKNVQLKHKLENGDHIEIITSKNQKPKSDWLNFVITSKAKSKIKQFLQDEAYKYAQTGKETLKRRLKNWKIKETDELTRFLLKYYDLDKPKDLYNSIATEKIDISDIKEVILNSEKENQDKNTDESDIKKQKKKDTDSKKEPSKSNNILELENNVDGLDYKFAKCCNPIFGDEIFGFITINDGIKIHRKNCPNAQNLLSKYHYRVISAKWKKSAKKESFQTIIKISGIDKLGILSKISDIISKDMKVHMQSITINSNSGLFEGKIKLLVDNNKHLGHI
ncbi:MAG: RelA/SpoT family protein, partial [Bacteroidota bacterium]|nr:RelA/SpoT family protein [Bacteroidota bacterium]